MLRTKMPLWFSYWRVQKAFPELSGSFAVGCTDFMCPKNDSADSDASKEAGGIFVRFFYPTAKTAETQDEANHCRWVPRREYTTGMVNFMQLPTWLLGRLFYWTVGSVHMPAVYNAPILKPISGSPERESLPCIVFSHGLGGNRLVYSHFCCDLASRGCLVAAIEHRDQSASATFVLHVNNNDSKVTEEWIRYRKLKPTDDEFRLRNSQVHKRSDECIHAHNLLEMIHAGNFPPNLFNDTSVLQELKGRLDLSRVAMVGHSFGGATTVLSLAKDKRFRCGVALDVWMLPLGEDIYNYEVEQPLLFINTQAFHRWPENHEPLKTFINKKPATRPIIAIRWTKHMNQCDIPAVLPPYILRVTALGGKLSPTISLSLNCQAIWAHVSRHLGLRFLDLENEDPGQTFGTLAEIKDIGNPPQRIPIIDGGEGTPKLVIIGQDFIPATEDLREMMAAGDFSRDALKGSL